MQSEIKNKNQTKLPKLHKFFDRKFSKRDVQKKLLKKLYIPADKEFIIKFLVKKVDEKNKEVYLFDKTKMNNTEVIKRLNRIGREIHRQRGRINFIPIFAAIVTVLFVLVFIYLFRNIISRKLVIDKSEEAFGGKCEIGYIDFDLWHTRFQIKDYTVANKKSVMRNLIEVKSVDLYFDLLELTRGKLIAENIAVEGVTWNTPRKTSGALPPGRIKPKDPNAKPHPLIKMIQEEMKYIKEGVSISAGLQAVREKTDPKLILKREINALQTPKVKDEIMNEVPVIVSKWENVAQETRTDIDTLVSKSKEISKVDVSEFQTVSDVKNFILQLNDMVKLSEKNIGKAKKVANDVKNDAIKVKDFSENVNKAFTNDMSRIKKAASEINEIRVGGSGKYVSSIIRVFYIETLGTYYPRLIETMDKIKNRQKTAKPKKPPTLADKYMILNRLKGRDIFFTNHSLPSLVLKNVSLSGHHPENKFKISGVVKNVTNNADQLNLPIDVFIKSEQSKLKETLNGILDLRTKTPEFIVADFDFNGLDIDLQSPTEGIPSLGGILEAKGEAKLLKNHDLEVIATGVVQNAKLDIKEFEPAFVHNIFNDILHRVDTVDLVTELKKLDTSEPFLDIYSSVDTRIAKAIQARLSEEVQKVKTKLIAEGQKYLNDLQLEYSSELSKFINIEQLIDTSILDSNAVEKMLNGKMKEANARITEIAKSKVKDVSGEIKNEIGDTLKNIFN